MSDDLLSKAEALLAKRLPPGTLHLKIEDAKAMAQMKVAVGLCDIVPELVTEIRRLRSAIPEHNHREIIKSSMLEQLAANDVQISELQAFIKTQSNAFVEGNKRTASRLVKWQATAIDRTAQIGWMTSCRCGRLPDTLKWDYCDWSQDIPQSVQDGWNAWAAKELDLQTTQGASYLDRLEAAFLETTRQVIYSNFGMDGVDRPEGEEAYAEKVAQEALAAIRAGGKP
jgi:hypothetical protein